MYFIVCWANTRKTYWLLFNTHCNSKYRFCNVFAHTAKQCEIKDTTDTRHTMIFISSKTTRKVRLYRFYTGCKSKSNFVMSKNQSIAWATPWRKGLTTRLELENPVYNCLFYLQTSYIIT